MKIKILILIILLFPTFCYAEKCYVYIDKIGIVEKGQEAGQNEYGDVIGICPYTKQYKPTIAELSRYKIMVVDLTDAEIQILTEPEGYLIGVGEEISFVTTKARKRKIDIDKMKSIKQEAEVAKTTLINNIITKSP